MPATLSSGYKTEETFYQAMRRQGVSRRSFLKFCSLAATT
ncbi:MAG: twin-arginine translocation signal domain-containing protein, partial [Plesiomonas shigelloides]